MRPLPPDKQELSGRQSFTNNRLPFINNRRFSERFMLYVYALQAALIVLSAFLGVWRVFSLAVRVLLFCGVYAVHELLHLAVIWRTGDISITHSGIFLWITPGATLSKRRFFMFMSLPLLALTAAPAFVLLLGAERLGGTAFDLIKYSACVNAIIAGADIINSILIAIKPRAAMFRRGYYTIPDKKEEQNG